MTQMGLTDRGTGVSQIGKNVSRLNFETRWKDEILKSLDVPQEEITQVRSEG